MSTLLKLSLISLLFVVCLSRTYSEFETRAIFEEFKINYQKKYTFQEQIVKYEIFKQNLLIIEQLKNTEEGTAEYGVTKYSDLTTEQFSSTILMSPQVPKNFTKSRYTTLKKVSVPAPDHFDYRTLGAITDIKDQGFVGTCWAFSATGNIESQWFLARKNLTVVSEEQIVDCSADIDVQDKIKANCGVYGGWPYLAFEYVIRTGGLPESKSYPYCAGDDSCYVCSPAGFNQTRCGPPVPDCNTELHDCYEGKYPIAVTIEDWKAVSQDEEVIKQTLFEQGPLSVALDANVLQFYKRGVYASRLCTKTHLSHAVLMVGYGVEPKSLLHSETPYWIVKNSWGKNWGEEGYFRIKRGSGQCGINTAVTTSIVDKDSYKQTHYASEEETIESIQ